MNVAYSLSLRTAMYFACLVSVQLPGFATNLASDGLSSDSQWSWHFPHGAARTTGSWDNKFVGEIKWVQIDVGEDNHDHLML